ncbi:MAG: hypothetical protein A2Y12_16400 [Planctomycetes bacterium GWF2_42_9]|nr:MAG: hypothetical protein A2Y12_16400 [Planctomycetes bacterium GWF2_42_9]
MNRYLFFFLNLILVAIAYGSIPQWRVLPIRSQQEYQQSKIGGEAEQHPRDISRSVSNPNVIYISHDVAQVWRSDDAGTTWRKPLCKNLSLIYANSIEADPVNPDIVFVSVSYWYDWKHPDKEGVYRSTDGGNTWSFVLATTTHFDSSTHRIYRHSITFDPNSSDGSKALRWYAAFPKNGLFRSQDGGNTWNNVCSLATHNVIYKVMVNPVSGRVYIASDLGLYSSSECGVNLQKIGNLPVGPVTSLAINPQNPDMIYAVIKGNGLYRSTDAGATFSLLKSFNALFVFVNSGFPNTIYLVGDGNNNTIISHNGGSTWITNMYTVPAPGLGRDGSSWKSVIAGPHTAIAPNPTDENEAVAFSRATLWKTTDGGHSFVDSSTLFTGYAWTWWNNGGAAFNRLNSNRFAFFNFDVGMAITDSAGDYFDVRNSQAYTWTQQGIISWYSTHAGDFCPIANSNTIVASIGQTFSTQLMRSTDGGLNWQLPPINGQTLTSSNASTYSENNYLIAFNPAEPNIVYAGNKISADCGAHFNTVNFGAYASKSPSIIGMCNAVGSTIYAVSADRYEIYRSDNKGTNWNLYTRPGWKLAKYDNKPVITVDPCEPNIIYTLNSDGDMARFNGSLWTSFHILNLAGDDPANFVSNIAIDPTHPEIIYAATYSAGLPCVFRTTDGGSHWQDISSNLPRLGGSSIAVNPHTGELFKGSAAGTWIFPAPYPSPNTTYYKAYPRPTTKYTSDLNNDGMVDLKDFAIIASDYGKTGTACAGDISGPGGSSDGKVDNFDVKAFVLDYLKT